MTRLGRAWRAARGAALAGVAVVGCVGAFEAPSSGLDERYLCGDMEAVELEARARCSPPEAGERCEGLASVQGVLAGREVVLTAPVFQGRMAVAAEDAGDLRYRKDDLLSLSMGLNAHYYLLLMRFRDVGGRAVPGAPPLTRRCEFTRLTALAENTCQLALELTNNSSTVSLQSESGFFEATTLSATHIEARFESAYLGSTDYLEGCFWVRDLELSYR